MNRTVWRYRRTLAQQESVALRLLVRAHGYLPACRPNQWWPW